MTRRTSCSRFEQAREVTRQLSGALTYSTFTRATPQSRAGSLGLSPCPRTSRVAAAMRPSRSREIQSTPNSSSRLACTGCSGCRRRRRRGVCTRAPRRWRSCPRRRWPEREQGGDGHRPHTQADGHTTLRHAGALAAQEQRARLLDAPRQALRDADGGAGGGDRIAAQDAGGDGLSLREDPHLQLQRLEVHRPPSLEQLRPRRRARRQHRAYHRAVHRARPAGADEGAEVRRVSSVPEVTSGGRRASVGMHVCT
mmetsp:Transcript_5547/g.12224  ORF Transcript_5547/g.12224 Transcript_5547/m.12224 type:complete len:254 (-) Transcript_5547:282-1043(-)